MSGNFADDNIEHCQHKMLDLTSFYTFSGVFVFSAVFAATYRWFTFAGLLLTIAGAGGLASSGSAGQSLPGTKHNWRR